MKEALIIFDSVFGNTAKISESLRKSIEAYIDVDYRNVGEVLPEHLEGINVLIVGSPTRQFKETNSLNQFLKQIPKNGFMGIKIAAFDTRMKPEDINKNRFLAFMVKLFGFAAEKISKQLKKLGGIEIVPPEGFFVEDVEGPLVEGELERAAEWGLKIIGKVKN